MGSSGDHPVGLLGDSQVDVRSVVCADSLHFRAPEGYVAHRGIDSRSRNTLEALADFSNATFYTAGRRPNPRPSRSQRQEPLPPYAQGALHWGHQCLLYSGVRFILEEPKQNPEEEKNDEKE